MMECARDIKLFGLEARFTLRLPHEPRDHPGLMHGVQTIKSEAGSWDSIECTYTKVDYDLKHLIDLRVTLKIYDIDRPSGGEHMVLEYQYKSMFVKLPNWLDPPRVPCSGQPKPSQALPLPRVYPNRLLTDTPIYRKNDQRGAGYLAKLGHEVGVLTAAGLALTRNGIRSRFFLALRVYVFWCTEGFAGPAQWSTD